MNTPALATRYVFDTYGAQTTGLAMLDPGYDPHPSAPGSPSITRDMHPALVDFVFSQQLSWCSWSMAARPGIPSGSY